MSDYSTEAYSLAWMMFARRCAADDAHPDMVDAAWLVEGTRTFWLDEAQAVIDFQKQEDAQGPRIGAMLDRLGLSFGADFDDGDLVSSAVVVLSVLNAESHAIPAIAVTDGMSWIEQVGLLRIAERIASRSEED